MTRLLVLSFHLRLTLERVTKPATSFRGSRQVVGLSSAEVKLYFIMLTTAYGGIE